MSLMEYQSSLSGGEPSLTNSAHKALIYILEEVMNKTDG